MTTRRFIALVFGSTLVFAGAAGAETYKIDGVHSAAVFRVSHMGVSYSYGRFNDIDGTMTLDDADPSKWSFDVTIKTESVDTANDKRDKHLRSQDFFNAKQFPVMTFKSTSVAKGSDGTYDVTGDFALLGVTKSITVKVEHVGSGDDGRGNYRSGIETVFTIDRTDFGMNYMPDGLGKEVRVMVGLEGVRE